MEIMELQIVNIIITTIAVLAAAIISPIATYYFTNKLSEKRQKEELKLRIFAELMATRHDPLSEESVKYLNLIDIVFAGEKHVRDAWAVYYDHLSDSRLNDNSGNALRDTSKKQLLKAMAQSIHKLQGFGDADLSRTYAPTFLAEKQELAYYERQHRLAFYRNIFSSFQTSLNSAPNEETKAKLESLPLDV